MNGMSVMMIGSTRRDAGAGSDPNSTPARTSVSRMYVFSVRGGTKTLWVALQERAK